MTKLVFLHGSGGCKDDYEWLLNEVAKMFDAKLVSFNAPFDHDFKPYRYKWFCKFDNNGRRDAVIDDYNRSLNYIINKLGKLGKDMSDIILIGHSQGGGMAVHVGLEVGLKGVISINGDLPYNVDYQIKANTPIYWFESNEDIYLSDERKQSYKLISDNNNFHRFVFPNSTHTEFRDDLLEFLKLKVIEF